MLSNPAQRRKDEQRIRDAGRLPPGQALTHKFPVLHYGPVPEFNPAVWNFRIWGEVEQPLQLTWDEFQALPRTRVEMDLHCVTRWSKVDTVWEGVSLKTLINQGLLKLKPGAPFRHPTRRIWFQRPTYRWKSSFKIISC